LARSGLKPEGKHHSTVIDVNAYIVYNACIATPLRKKHCMAMLTVRNLDDAVKTQLRVQAARHGCAMEEEVRRILTQATLGAASATPLGSRIHARFRALGSFDTPARSLPRAAPPL
jgi:antitoxin FitA